MIEVPLFQEKVISHSDQVETAKTVLDLVEKSFDITRDGEPGSTNSIWDQEIKAFLDATTLKSLFFSEDWVYICVDLIASKISTHFMWVVKEEIVDDRVVKVPVPKHPLNALLKKPNSWQDYHAFMYLVCVEYFLMGNVIIWHNKRNNTLMVLSTERVSLEFNKKNNQVSAYVYSTGNSETDGLIKTNDKMVFPVDEIIHIRRPNPASLLWGLSPFIPGRKSVLFNRYSSDYLNAFYLKQATPGLALSIDKMVNEDVALRQLRSFEMAYTGRKNARKSLILPKGVEAKPLTHSLSDQKLVEQIDKNRETIINLLKVPKHELSLQKVGSLGSEEHRLALRNFWESTLLPGAKQISGAFTNHFEEELEENNHFEFDLTNVEALQEDKVKRAELAEKLSKTVLSVNEVRRDLFNKEASTAPNADVPGFLIPKNIAAPLMIDAEESDLEPDVENEDNEDKSLQAVDDKALDGYLLSKGLTVELINKQLQDDNEEPINELSDVTLDIFLDMAEIALKLLRDMAKSKSLQTKQDDEPADLDPDEYRRRLERAFDNLSSVWNEAYMQLESSVEAGWDTQFRFVDGERDREALAAIRARTEDGRRAILAARGIEAFNRITDTETEMVMRRITSGLVNNESIDQIAARVRNTFSDPDKRVLRANTIARTEVLTAVSQGQWAMFTAAKEVMGDGIQKVWITADDARVRPKGGNKASPAPNHRKLHRKMIPVDQKFENDLRFPRDPRGSAGEVINCFPEDTDFSAVNPELIYRRHYVGPMVSVYIAGENELTGTPNHPILTNRGWVPLGKLKKGDQVIKVGKPILSSDYGNVVAVKAKAGELFNAISEPAMLVREGRSVVNFHGDATNQDVDVKNIDGCLRLYRWEQASKSMGNFGFQDSNFTQGGLLSDSSFKQPSSRAFTSDGIMGRSNLIDPLTGSHLAPLKLFSFASTSPSKAKLSKITANRNSGDIEDFAQLRDRKIFSDMHFVNVEKVEIKSFSGHVFNLQTSDGVYSANNIISHNCRCTLIMVPKGETIEGFRNE